MKGMNGSRFSPADYSAKLRSNAAMAGTQVADGMDGDGNIDFERLTEEMKSYLAAPRGLSEEERRQYNETLNRAVLGFASDREQVLAIIADRLIQLRLHQLDGYTHSYQTLAEALFAEVVGLNALELILKNKEGLEEIQVVGTAIYEVRGGKTISSRYRFEHVREVERIQQNLVLYNNDRISPRKRWAEVVLRDGSRVTMTGFGFTSKPTLTIRFFTVRSFSLEALIDPAFGTLNMRMKVMLEAVLQSRFNLVIIGPTNSGKTHLMKALIAGLPNEERIVTIEGRFEMMLGRDFPDKNTVEYETDEDDPQHRASQAFKLALRQSPERIIHAEIRDMDANIYVRACTRGHSGSMTTVHANALEDVPEAICDMCMLDGRGMNPDRLTKRIAEYVTQIGIEMRNLNGRRLIARIGEIGWEAGKVRVLDWVRFDEQAGEWVYPNSPSVKASMQLARGGAAID
ncbi:ATPase, T2SS/T4P/T4SS family [Paenibacillus sp. NEAU-GSW1]|uniref:ATPase, T2SS/T4P/T4SS family n=1 Tax=Paenibacillus sp. NEAU-GSW1 TaxID=2682486 RepID=UPI0012E0F4CF|nr:ATPase, T2SS/T4P/T4SS family [Paenibacillus sp. NEAU-GSW1]MUT68637.1 CpaF family protein [Paenibacillus sp. NEAU-GSW1]